MFLKTDEKKRDLLKTVVQDINDWRNKTKNKLNLYIQQGYKESASEMIKVNNVELLQQIITNNENKELLFSQKISKQKNINMKNQLKKFNLLDLFYVIMTTVKTTTKTTK